MAIPPLQRLQTTLLISGLQIKDPPLYQVISQLIGYIQTLANDIGSGGGGGGGSTVNNIFNNNLLIGAWGDSDGGDGSGDILIIPNTNGGGGSGDGEFVPYYIAPDETFTVPLYKQAVFAMNIEVDGILEVDGFLIEVDREGIPGETTVAAIPPVFWNDSSEGNDGFLVIAEPSNIARYPLDLLSGQIKFPATQIASSNVNTLDDYEEGTWTPTITAATPGDLAITYAVRVGSYTKIGDTVRIAYTVVSSAFTWTTAAGNFRLTGLPFTSANVALNFAFSMHHFGGFTGAGFTQLLSQLAANSAVSDFTMDGSGIAPAAVQIGNFPTGGALVAAGVIIYQAPT